MLFPLSIRTPIISAIKCTLQSAFVLLIVSTCAWSSALDQLEQTELPADVEKQSKTTKLINYLIEKSHYRKVSLNDEFSERVLDTFIDSLDPSRSFFLSQDIEKFDELRYEVDDYIKQGNLDLAYAIFKVYRSRVNQRIEFSLERLEQPFDFSIEENFILDREDTDWADSEQEINDYWRKRIKNDILNLKLAAKNRDEIQETLKIRYTHIARRTHQFKSEDIFQSFINAYVTTIEPHTSYYSPRGAENFKIHMRLSLEGIGAVLQTENEHTLVRRVIPGGPADFSGALNAEDRIIGVGQENEEIVDVIGWRLDDVVDLIRGPKESIVNLEILPSEDGLDGESETITIVRDKIKLEEQAASKRVLEIGSGDNQSTVGIIDLPSFYSDFDGRNVNDPDYRSTTKDVRKLVEEMKLSGIDGLIIDLRGNGGGALTEAISLTGLFIEKGPVVQVQHSNGRTQVDRDPDPEIIYDGPMSVLVDRYSASASEIFAGAIQDYNRGLIIGESTFGKGTVQNLVSLNRFVNSDEDLGQLKVTIAQFFRINGDSTQHRGVVPNISWHVSELEEDFGESSFENAIPWRHIDEVDFTPFVAELDDSVLDKAREIHLKRVENNAEFEYAFEANKINKTYRERTSITLSEKSRTDDRKTRDAVRLALENTRRASLGKSTYTSVEVLEQEKEKEEKKRERVGDENSQPDAFLVESANILVDFIHLTSESDLNKQATTLVNSNSANSEALLSN